MAEKLQVSRKSLPVGFRSRILVESFMIWGGGFEGLGFT